MHGITEDQFLLSSRAGISIDVSNELADFEREAYVNLLIRDIRTEVDNIRGNKHNG